MSRTPPILEPIHLFALAARQARWLATSQAVIAGNVANANTPDYKARSVRPFADVLDQAQLQIATTNAGHLGVGLDAQSGFDTKADDPWEVTESGNSVSVEQEMIKAGDVNRSFALNTSIVKAFHGMLSESLKGP